MPFTWGDIGGVAKGFGHWWKESMAGGGKQSGGGQSQQGSSGGPPINPNLDAISNYVKAYGATGQAADPNTIYNFIKQTDPAALKSPDKVRQYMNQYAAYNKWQPGGGGASTSASVIDPLAVQMFFQNTIAPYMNQVAGNEKQTSDQMRNQPSIPGLPQSYNAVLQAGHQNQANDMDMLQQATTASAMNQPRVDQLIQMLGLVQQSQLKNYYATTQGTAAGQGAQSLPTS